MIRQFFVSFILVCFTVISFTLSYAYPAQAEKQYSQEKQFTPGKQYSQEKQFAQEKQYSQEKQFVPEKQYSQEKQFAQEKQNTEANKETGKS